METQAWQFEMTRPLWLAALLVVPLLVYYCRRGLVHFANWQRTAALTARTVLVLLVVLALCGIRIVSQNNQPFVVFAVDRSSSIGKEAGEKAEKFVAEARAGREDQSAIVEFAATADEVDAESAGANEPKPAATDISAALQSAGAMIPANQMGKIVLLSEGRQTAGDALAAAKACRWPISTVHLPALSPEAYVAAVETPAEARLGEAFPLTIVVQATFAGEGKLTLLKDGEPVEQKTVSIAEGKNRFDFQQTITEGAAAKFTARLDVPGDTLSTNNELSAAVLTRPPPRVLLVESEAGAGLHLAEALSGRWIEVQRTLPADMPADIDGMTQYDLAILSNISAEVLPSGAMEALDRYVRDFGGGLIVVGGEKTFTPGGYDDTLIEDILPLKSNIRKDKSKPSLAMALVLDRSGSMKGQSIELAKQATRRAVEMLGPRDQVGIVAFEDKSRWVSPMGPCSDKRSIFQRIDTIKAAGGTNMYPAVEKAFAALDESFADTKHMIVLTDGLSHPGDFQQLTDRIAAAGITVSTVAVGDEAAPELLQDIAKTGKGQYHHCADAAAVPRIFALETISAAKLGVTEEPFIPQAAEPSEMLAELDLSKMPTLLGYAETTPKPTARVILNSETDDPLLASWKYGRGTSIAFTSDVQSRWAAAWLNWKDFPLFWEKLARGAMRKETFGNYSLRAETAGDDHIDIALDAIDDKGGLINGAAVELEVREGDGAPRGVPFEQVAPGRYAARLDVSEKASAEMPDYTFHATLRPEGKPGYSGRRKLLPGYDDELRIGGDPALLAAIAKTTGGVADISAADVFTASDDSATTTAPLWLYLLAAALLVFLADVALKRVELG